MGGEAGRLGAWGWGRREMHGPPMEEGGLDPHFPTWPGSRRRLGVGRE